jgi:hypothetical protein
MAAKPRKEKKDRRDEKKPADAQRPRKHEEKWDAVDEASDQSFPASDPPSFTPASVSGPQEGLIEG